MRVENNTEKSRITGLELREPAPVFNVKPGTRFLMVGRPAYFIPLSPVVSNWQQGELAEPLLQRALAIYEQQLGREHPTTQTVHDNYVTLTRKMKREKK